MISLSDALAVMRKVDRSGQPIPFVLEYDPFNQDTGVVGSRKMVKAVMHWSNNTHTRAYNPAKVAKAADGLAPAPKRILNKFKNGIVTIKLVDSPEGNNLRFVHTMLMVRLNNQLIKLHIHG